MTTVRSMDYIRPFFPQSRPIFRPFLDARVPRHQRGLWDGQTLIGLQLSGLIVQEDEVGEGAANVTT